MKPVRIVVADDHVLFREGLLAIFGLDPRVVVVGEASNGTEAVATAVRESPDLLLLDVSMPGLPVLATITTVRRRAPGTRIAILTMHDEAALGESLLSAGASAFWSKSHPSRDLVEAIVALIRAPRTGRHEPARRRKPAAGVLSPREVEVVQLVGTALTNREIAAQLGIAEGTVKRHLSSIFEKLGAASRLDAARKAARLGIVALD